MARPERVEYTDAAHHFTAPDNERKVIVREDADRQRRSSRRRATGSQSRVGPRPRLSTETSCPGCVMCQELTPVCPNGTLPKTPFHCNGFYLPIASCRSTDMIPSFQAYLSRANRSMAQACYSCDLAASAHKMISASCAGPANMAWRTGPYLCAPAGTTDIDHSFPYVLRFSERTSKVLGICLGAQNSVEHDEQSVGCPLPVDDGTHLSVILMQCCVTQYAILESYEFDLARDVIKANIGQLANQKVRIGDIFERDVSSIREEHVDKQLRQYRGAPAGKRLKEYFDAKLGIPLEDPFQAKFKELADQRNRYAHGIDICSVDLEMASSYFLDCLLVAKLLGSKLGDKEAAEYDFPWLPKGLEIECPEWTGIGVIKTR